MSAGTEYIAWWGAILSTLLAAVKLWELWSNRFRLEIGYFFTGLPEEGNEIRIRNLGPKPIIVTYWELLETKGVWPFRKMSTVEHPEFDAGDFHIEPHGSKVLKLFKERYFDWGGGKKFSIRLHIAGRGSVLLKVND